MLTPVNDPFVRIMLATVLLAAIASSTTIMLVYRDVIDIYFVAAFFFTYFGVWYLIELHQYNKSRVQAANRRSEYDLGDLG